jgi:hypothetical protein
MDFDKIFNTFIENKLRKAEVKTTSGNFTKLLMNRVNAESNTALEENKRDRVAKYIIGSFIFLTIAFTVLAGLFSSSKTENVTKDISFEPAIDTSSNYFWQFIDGVSSFFVNALDVVGLSISIETVSIIAGLLLVLTLFFLADKIFIRGKLKSQQM